MREGHLLRLLSTAAGLAWPPITTKMVPPKDMPVREPRSFPSAERGGISLICVKREGVNQEVEESREHAKGKESKWGQRRFEGSESREGEGAGAEQETVERKKKSKRARW